MTDVDIESVLATHCQERLQVGLSDAHRATEAMGYESAIVDPPSNGARAHGESIRDLGDGIEALNRVAAGVAVARVHGSDRSVPPIKSEGVYQTAGL